ncbi:MAG TPA: hypothetical protein VEB65_05095 [Solirubrobacterales bacterium]|nr:hypothetical protein [Solirubrobacterales bacterium]
MGEATTLEPLGTWGVISRGRFHADHGGHDWTIEVDYFDLGDRVTLYRDGVRAKQERSPARFQLGAGTAIEAKVGLLGMERAVLVAAGGERRLTPVEGTAEWWRFELERRRPELSRLLGWLAWAVLVAAVFVDGTQLLGLAGVDVPFRLSGTAATVIGFAALAAALERALAMRSNRWLG